jgi:hypothetical protein
MKIVRLEPVHRAPANADSIMISATQDGRFTALGITASRDRNDTMMVTLTPRSVKSEGEAEAAGIRWANMQPIDVLYIERSKLS